MKFNISFLKQAVTVAALALPSVVFAADITGSRHHCRQRQRGYRYRLF